MTNRADLEQRLANALDGLSKEKHTPIDLAKYAKAFHASARSKAEGVLEALASDQNPFKGQMPVFVSVGGADGEELVSLLENSNATRGILLEGSHDLSESARQRTIKGGKHIEIFQGDAKELISKAIGSACEYVRSGGADYLVVTCHAVIHELFDRGGAFDPVGFFSSIFADPSIPTWFTYREPGAPEKWPEQILLGAGCGPQGLQRLADQLCLRHGCFKALTPPPQVVGDDLRAHRTLAMEVIVKLFYLEDLQYELQERSTSVDHQQMQSCLALAIGDKAANSGRMGITSTSSATDSFARLWKEWGLRARGLKSDISFFALALPESQTRVIAWRKPPEKEAKSHTEKAEGGQKMPVDLGLAVKAKDSGDFELMQAMVISNGRSWIERDESKQAIELLLEIRKKSKSSSLIHQWSNYLLALSDLFKGHKPSARAFTDGMIRAAAKNSLDILFLAEQMEFHRKAGKHKSAVSKANRLAGRLSRLAKVGSEPHLARYAIGTAFFVFANLLRSGGLYPLAIHNLELANHWLVKGIESHETERLHCSYASAVCRSICGDISFTGSAGQSSEPTQRFAGALIQLTYSYAAWNVDDLTKAETYALDAASTFKAIGAVKYCDRASTIAALYRVWVDLSANRPIRTESIEGDLADGVRFIAGQSEEFAGFRKWFRSLRPSTAAGLLQFRKFSKSAQEVRKGFELPHLLTLHSKRGLEWMANKAGGLDEAAKMLRCHLGAHPSNRIPLLAD